MARAGIQTLKGAISKLGGLTNAKQLAREAQNWENSVSGELNKINDQLRNLPMGELGTDLQNSRQQLLNTAPKDNPFSVKAQSRFNLYSDREMLPMHKELYGENAALGIRDVNRDAVSYDAKTMLDRRLSNAATERQVAENLEEGNFAGDFIPTSGESFNIKTPDASVNRQISDASDRTATEKAIQRHARQEEKRAAWQQKEEAKQAEAQAKEEEARRADEEASAWAKLGQKPEEPYNWGAAKEPAETSPYDRVATEAERAERAARTQEKIDQAVTNNQRALNDLREGSFLGNGKLANKLRQKTGFGRFTDEEIANRVALNQRIDAGTLAAKDVSFDSVKAKYTGNLGTVSDYFTNKVQKQYDLDMSNIRAGNYEGKASDAVKKAQEAATERIQAGPGVMDYLNAYHVPETAAGVGILAGVGSSMFGNGARSNSELYSSPF